MTPRVPDLTGALNFRDLGGYQSVDGRKVRWQILYRSGTTHAMTNSDLAALEKLGIRYAYDLRSNTERRAFPSRLTEIAQITYRFLDHDRRSGDIKRLLRSADAHSSHAHDVMVSVYRRLPYDLRDAFSTLFRHLASGNVPLVFNCTAGKDRTGVATALVLTALGVPHEAILCDYLLTGQFFDRSCELILNETNKTLFTGVDRTIWEPIMSTHSDYLNAMFDELNESHGSVARYIAEDLGVDDATIEKLKFVLLE
jgi:protein-tyrosine phosphatase